MRKVVASLIVILLVIIGFVFWNDSESNERFLDEQFTDIESLFKHREVQNLEVSKADVAWHLDHMLKTINRLSEALAQSDPQDFESKFNMQRVFVHTTGYIPRGAAQSPPSVRPPDHILLDSLNLQLKQAKQNLKTIANLDDNSFFAHPVFDHLDRDQTRRFLEIHTNHHLKIIKDILEE